MKIQKIRIPKKTMMKRKRKRVKNYKEQLNDLNTEFSKYKKITQTHPKLIKAYTNFYNDLTKYGEKKVDEKCVVEMFTRTLLESKNQRQNNS